MESNNEAKILPITAYGSQILREVCVPAENTPEVQTLVKDMVKTMLSISTSVGLAANQVNSNLRIFTMEVYGTLTVVINPIIKKSRGSEKSTEGCLSLPGLNETVPDRAKIIEVEFYNEKFEKRKIKFEGFQAIVFQHEINHLDGILFTDLLTKEGKESVQDKLSDISKGIYTTKYQMINTNL